MAIESDAQGDLALDADDAENVAGGREVKASKAQLRTGLLVESQPKEEPKRSLEGLEQHG